MNLPHFILPTAIASLALLTTGISSRGQSVNISLSTVGDPNNAADTVQADVGGGTYGSVPYSFNIGTYDVTISQYCTFLNAVATYSDPYGLYNTAMESMGNDSTISGVAGIQQTLSLGTYSYSVSGGSDNDPVTQVSWFDAVRFCNWLQNGQLTITGSLGETVQTTEAGAYALNGDTTNGMETASPSAVWRLPTEDEWYKAAYYSPNYGGPGVAGYYAYATQSDTVPGNSISGGSNQANYFGGNGYAVTQSPDERSDTNYLTATGTFSTSASYYGTYDQNGDVYQWNDASVVVDSGTYRGLRGGAWSTSSDVMQSSSRAYDNPADVSPYTGFRVVETAGAVPEPNSLMLIPVGALGLWAMRRKRARQKA